MRQLRSVGIDRLKIQTNRNLRFVCLHTMGPVEDAFLPDEEESRQNEDDKSEHLDESEHFQLLENDGPGIKENGLDIEQDEEHRNQIKPHAETVPGIASWFDTALVRQVFHLVLESAPNRERQGNQRGCYDHRQQCLHKYREPGLSQCRRHLDLRFKGGGRPHDYNNPQVPVATENQVTVNGERRRFPVRTSLLDIVQALELEPQRVAIELNREIVKRDSWSRTVVADGAEIEIVQFVGGG